MRPGERAMAHVGDEMPLDDVGAVAELLADVAAAAEVLSVSLAAQDKTRGAVCAQALRSDALGTLYDMSQVAWSR